MNTNAPIKIVLSSSEKWNLLSLLGRKKHAHCAEESQIVSEALSRFIIGVMASRGVELNPEKILDQREFVDYMDEAIKNLTTKDACSMLDKNAWKILGMAVSMPDDNDPENVWRGQISFVDSAEFPEFYIDSDRLDIVIKKMAILSELLDIGE